MALLSGPTGGVVGFAFGMGCTAGYAFATRTALAAQKEQTAEMKADRDYWRGRAMGDK